MKYALHVLALSALGFGVAACGGGTNSINTVPVTTPVTGYKQIELLSRPAVKELFEKFVDHQTSNASEPYADPTLQTQIAGLTDALRPKLTTAGATDYGAVIASVLYPNWITADISQTAGATYLGYEITAGHAAFGGRQPADDVIDTSLGVVFGRTLVTLGLAVEDNQENNCLTTDHVSQNATQVASNTFPYLHAPH